MTYVYHHDTMFVSSLICLVLVGYTIGDIVFELDLQLLFDVHDHAYPVTVIADTISGTH